MSGHELALSYLNMLKTFIKNNRLRFSLFFLLFKTKSTIGSNVILSIQKVNRIIVNLRFVNLMYSVLGIVFFFLQTIHSGIEHIQKTNNEIKFDFELLGKEKNG